MFNYHQIESDVSPITWPQRLANVSKALWSLTARPAVHTTATATTAAEKPVLLTLRASLPADRTDVVCLAMAGELTRHTYTSLIEKGKPLPQAVE